MAEVAPPTSTPPASNASSPVAKGEPLRFKAKAGDRLHSRVKVVIEQEQVATEGAARNSDTTIMQFTFGIEEKVESVASDGAIGVRTRLVDAVGQAQQPVRQKTADQLALAFDELKIQYQRQPRGEISSLTLAGVRRPLDEATARQVLNAVLGAERGNLLPDLHVDVGASWNTKLAIPARSGFDGEVNYDYTLANKEGTAASIRCEGQFEGKRSGQTISQKLTGKSSADYRFDVTAGRLLGSTVDLVTQDEGALTGKQGLQMGMRQHLHVEATLDPTES